MSGGFSRGVPCGEASAVARLEKAEAFAVHAELDPLSADGAARSAAASNAVLAGIAAALYLLQDSRETISGQRPSRCCGAAEQRARHGPGCGALPAYLVYR